MGNCNPPYKNGVGDLSWCGCSCSNDGGGCFKPECYDSVFYNYSCSNTCSSFSGMNFIFYAIHGCNRAKYKFYIGEYDSNGKWNDTKKIFVANINLNSGPEDAPNALPAGQNPYPCPGPPNPDGLSCCIPSGSTLSVQEVTIGANIINNLSLTYTNDDCVQIPVKIECDTPGGCHSDATQCIILTSDKSCCLGTGAFDSSKAEPGNPDGPVGVNTVDLCCKPCTTCIKQQGGEISGFSGSSVNFNSNGAAFQTLIYSGIEGYWIGALANGGTTQSVTISFGAKKPSNIKVKVGAMNGNIDGFGDDKFNYFFSGANFVSFNEIFGGGFTNNGSSVTRNGGGDSLFELNASGNITQIFLEGEMVDGGANGIVIEVCIS